MKGNRRRAVLLALLWGALASGCGRKEAGSPFGGRADLPVRLRVENQNFLDVTIYAVAGGGRIRLGNVTGKGSGSFTLDPREIPLVRGLQVLADPLGSARTYLSPAVFPHGGSTVVLTLGAVLSQSFISIR
jgi:hypothetical protein